MTTEPHAYDPEWIRRVTAEAEHHRAAIEAGRQDGHTLTTLVYTEAGCGWFETGLVHESYSGRDIQEISGAIADQVAASMVLAGWTPPGGAS